MNEKIETIIPDGKKLYWMELENVNTIGDAIRYLQTTFPNEEITLENVRDKIYGLPF